ncbi:MAG: hypothetical protein J2P36_34545, partial [Ktedonobacteraceae bacterium]|nr:hypothetical protein [Ktedonobacteraceae bacterium]
MDRPERQGVDSSLASTEFGTRGMAADSALDRRVGQGDEPPTGSDTPNKPASLIGDYLQGILRGEITDLPGGPTTDLGETKDLSMATRDLYNQLRASQEQAGDHPLSHSGYLDAHTQLFQIVDMWRQPGMGERTDLAGRALGDLIHGGWATSTEKTFNALRTQLIEQTIYILDTVHHAETVPLTQLQTAHKQLDGILGKVPDDVRDKPHLQDMLDELDGDLRRREPQEISKLYGEWVKQSFLKENSRSDIISMHDQLTNNIRPHLLAIQARSDTNPLDIQGNYKASLREKLNALHIPDNPQEAGLPDDIRERVFLVIDTIKDDI